MKRRSAPQSRLALHPTFTYSTPKQVQALYTTLLAPLCKDTLSDAQKARLVAMKNLAPGDFHAVQGQYGSFFVDRSKVTHDVLLDALEKETKLKLEHTAKPLGFRA